MRYFSIYGFVGKFGLTFKIHKRPKHASCSSTNKKGRESHQGIWSTWSYTIAKQLLWSSQLQSWNDLLDHGVCPILIIYTFVIHSFLCSKYVIHPDFDTWDWYSYLKATSSIVEEETIVYTANMCTNKKNKTRQETMWHFS